MVFAIQYRHSGSSSRVHGKNRKAVLFSLHLCELSNLPKFLNYSICMSSPYDYAYWRQSVRLSAVSSAIWAGANVMNLVVLNFRMSADAEKSLQPA